MLEATSIRKEKEKEKILKTQCPNAVHVYRLLLWFDVSSGDA